MIVLGLGGRKGSGKTELAKVCEKNGFIILSFASELKKLVGEMIDKTIEEVQRDKEIISSYTFSDSKLKFLSEKTEINIDVINSLLKGKTFSTIRELLQVIGTDLIRRWNSDWHVNQFRKILKKNVNYCFDDVRFPNEKKFIENELNGVCWFIFRPNYTMISNHESEISLEWTDYDTRIIVNNIPLNSLINRWKYYVQYGMINTEFSHNVFDCNSTIELREKIILFLKVHKSIEKVKDELNCELDKLMWWINHLVIPYELFTLDDSYAFTKIDRETTITAGLIHSMGSMIKDSSLNLIGTENINYYISKVLKKDIAKPKRVLPNGRTIYEIKIINPFIIENLKKWGIILGKNKEFLFPTEIFNGDEYLIRLFLLGIYSSESTIVIYNDGEVSEISFLMPPKDAYYYNTMLNEFKPKCLINKNGMINLTANKNILKLRDSLFKI